MRILSNVASVIESLERYPAHLNAAIEAALQPGSWVNEAVQVAAATLAAIAQGDEMLWIPDFISTVRANLLPEGERGFLLAMGPPADRRSEIGNFRSGNPIENAQEIARGGLELFSGDVVRVERDILDWVQTPAEEGGKERDERDSGKSDEEIADLISWIMLAPHTGGEGAADAARARLLPHIAAFIGRKQSQSMPPELVDQWLRAVLEAWRLMVTTQLTIRVRAALKRKL